MVQEFRLLKYEIISALDALSLDSLRLLAKFVTFLRTNIAQTEIITTNETAKLELMRQASTDPMFMADLQENMTAFAGVDAEWWEAIQLNDLGIRYQIVQAIRFQLEAHLTQRWI